MAKVITKYRGYTAAQLKSRATVPNQADMTIVGNDIYCSNITTAKIRNAIGVASNAIGNLSAHANVNEWSGFGPTVRSIAAQALVNNVGASPHAMGEFAGYNHTARVPGWITSAPSADMWINSGGDAVFSVNVYVGEIQYQLIAPAIVGIILAIYNNVGNLVAWGSRNFESDNVQDDVTSLQATLSGVYLEHTYTGKVWLVSDTSDFDESQITCRLPNTNNFTQTVKIKETTNLTINSTVVTGGGSSVIDGWTITSHGFNLTAGTCGFQDAYKNANFANVRIVAQLFNWLWEQVGTNVEMFNDVYYANSQLFEDPNFLANVKPNGDPIPAYGYHFKITIYETI